MPVELALHNEPLPLAAPFRIAGHVFEAMPATVVTLRDGVVTAQRVVPEGVDPRPS